MTQWTPQTQDGEAKCVAPYYFKDDRIQGFRDHAGGGAAQDRCRRARFPTSPRPRTNQALALRRHTGRFRDLRGNDRLGARRAPALSVSGSSEAVIVIQPNSRPGEGEIHVDLPAREIYGVNPVHRLYAGSGKLAGFSGYFVARFDQAFSSSAAWSGAAVHESSASLAHSRDFGSKAADR
jgi:hypothetical protein